ncbi:Mpm1p ASCRUDRAFT_24161, partial [Ascoidea rubescens DSM 1968]
FFKRFKEGGNNLGLWAYPIPSTNIYNVCKEKSGLSVWDEKGVWRCLFPKAIIPETEFAVSKEDVLSNTYDNNKYKFFQDYTKYLDWRLHMAEVDKQEREKRRLEAQTKFKEFYGLDKNSNSSIEKTDINKINESGKKVVGSSSSFSSTTKEDGSIENFTKIEKWFEDGTSEIKETRKVIPNDGSEPQIFENTKKLPSKNSHSWFWNS